MTPRFPEVAFRLRQGDIMEGCVLINRNHAGLAIGDVPAGQSDKRGI